MPLNLTPTQQDIGGIIVRRFLPHMLKRSVGPFVFFDHMGPAFFKAGSGINVKPHPHIGLATMTYLLEGSIYHRDSLGYSQEILPGEINWMTAGRGIVHSERETPEVRAINHRLNGVQVWVSLPPEHEQVDPAFVHVKKSAVPHIAFDKVNICLLAGSAYGQQAPVTVYSPLCFMDVMMNAGSHLALPAEHEELAVYLLEGTLTLAGKRLRPLQMCLVPDTARQLVAHEQSRVLVFGGKAFAKPPFMYWNFVSHQHQRLLDAAERWQQLAFDSIPGDDKDYVPLPAKKLKKTKE